MARKNTIRLLLINASDNESERLISLFRAAGRVARAHRVIDAADLDAQLRKTPNPLDQWDLLIADDHNEALPVEQCLEYLQQKRLPLPIIVVRADADLPALLASGAHDVVPAGDEQRLMFSALRGLETSEMRRKLLALNAQLKESEQRNTLLLGDAAEAIAYIADGMLINANQLFAERFGYASADDIDCLPVIDLIALEDHEKFKAGLKSGDGTEFSCRGITATGEAFAAQLTLGSAAVDGEPCLQITLQQPPQPVSAEAVHAGNDAESGLHTLTFLRRREQNNGALVLVAIDHFDRLRADHGYSASQQLAGELGNYLGTHHPFSPQTVSARAGESCFALLIPAATAERALDQAQAFALKLAKQHFNCGGADVHVTVSIGITDVQGGEIDPALDRSWRAIEALRDNASKPGIGNGAQILAPERVRDVTASQEELLQEALDDQRFILLFQPVISLRGAGGEHYEVLLRMRGEGDDIALPENFIEGLGHNAANAKLDRWMLLEATKKLADNRARGNDTRLLINLTSNALLDETLPPWLGVALKAAGIPADTLILQLRESDVANDPKTTKAFIDAIRQLGCRISYSNFGRASDPLKTLTSIGGNFVQLDGSFTRELQTGGNMQALRELVSKISAADVRVVIPFVENASVLASLWQAGADFIQGHYLQPPGREMNYEFADIA